MTPQRINLLGASGSGVSTLGRAVASAMSVPYFDCDDYSHEPSDPPFQNPRAPEARYALIVSALGRTKSWVLSGGVAGWVPYPQLDFTLIVFLWVPALIRIERLRRREHDRFGRRILKGGNMYEAHEAFIDWASRYDRGDIDGKTLARHEAYLADQTCPMLELRGAMPTSEAIHAILPQLRRFDD